MQRSEQITGREVQWRQQDPPTNAGRVIDAPEHVTLQGRFADPRFERVFSGWYWQVTRTDGKKPDIRASRIPTGCTSQPNSGNTVNLVSTCVSITYAYKWRFNSVITLLVPGATYAGVSHLNSTAVAFNEN